MEVLGGWTVTTEAILEDRKATCTVGVRRAEDHVMDSCCSSHSEQNEYESRFQGWRRTRSWEVGVGAEAEATTV